MPTTDRITVTVTAHSDNCKLGIGKFNASRGRQNPAMKGVVAITGQIILQRTRTANARNEHAVMHRYLQLVQSSD
jgi:hypothetical protein